MLESYSPWMEKLFFFYRIGNKPKVLQTQKSRNVRKTISIIWNRLIARYFNPIQLSWITWRPTQCYYLFATNDLIRLNKTTDDDPTTKLTFKVTRVGNHHSHLFQLLESARHFDLIRNSIIKGCSNHHQISFGAVLPSRESIRERKLDRFKVTSETNLKEQRTCTISNWDIETGAL